MNRGSLYKDKEKWKKTCVKQKKRYYSRTSYALNYRKKWTEEEIELIIEHKNTDTQLSKKLGRSVQSIQVKRAKMKGENNGRKKNVCKNNNR